MAKGDLARQMAHVPVEAGKDLQTALHDAAVESSVESAKVASEEIKQPRNRFTALFGRCIFKAVALSDPLKWDNGTLSTRLATVLIEFGKGTDSYLKASITLLEPVNGDPIVKLQMPSSGGKFKQSVIVIDNPQAEVDFQAWQDSVAREYIAWRKGTAVDAVVRSATVGVKTSRSELGL